MRSAIVGCGGIAQVHAQVLHLLEGVELSACADIRPERAEAMAQAFGCRAYETLETMLESEALDVLHICTPHALHVPMAEMAAARGIAVFTEKPPVISMSQWERFAALDGVVPIGICFQNRYNQTTARMKALLASGKMGKVLGARAFITWHRDAQYYVDSGWRGTWALEGGGVLINQAIHTLDLLTYLLGAPGESHTMMANHHLPGPIEVEDTVASRILFGDTPAIFYATTGFCVNSPVMLEVVCEHATARLEDSLLTVWWKNGRVERAEFEQDGLLGKGYWGNGHVACVADFYRCLKAGEAFPIGVSAVKASMTLAMRMYDDGGMRP